MSPRFEYVEQRITQAAELALLPPCNAYDADLLTRDPDDYCWTALLLGAPKWKPWRPTA